MKVTCFGDAVDKFFDVVNPQGVYMISKGQLKAANKARRCPASLGQIFKARRRCGRCQLALSAA